MEEKGVTVTEDCVEAELVHEGGSGPRLAGEQSQRSGFTSPPRPGLLGRLKARLAAGAAIAGIGLLITGILLTFTVIGAILGIPLILAGIALLALAFKLAASGSNNIFFFRKFP